MAVGMNRDTNSLDIIRFLLSVEGIDVNYYPTPNNSALRDALCRKEDFEVAKLLLDNGANPNQILDIGQTSLVMFLISIGYLNGALFLLNNATLDLTHKNIRGYTALDLAIKRNHQELIETITSNLSV